MCQESNTICAQCSRFLRFMPRTKGRGKNGEIAEWEIPNVVKATFFKRRDAYYAMHVKMKDRRRARWESSWKTFYIIHENPEEVMNRSLVYLRKNGFMLGPQLNGEEEEPAPKRDREVRFNTRTFRYVPASTSHKHKTPAAPK